MTQTHRKHVIFDPSTMHFLESYKQRHHLPSFSAAVQLAVVALEQQELRAAYQQFAYDYSQDEAAQDEAEMWLGLSMQETE